MSKGQTSEGQAAETGRTSGTPLPEEPVDISKVFDEELRQIQARRSKHFAESELSGDPDKDKEAISKSLVGLALSGGGIRSATFCLGLLQGFQRCDWLRIFDYVSTVSGGGYVGGWWSAWLTRPNSGDIFPGRENNELERARLRARGKAGRGYEEQTDDITPVGAESAGFDPVHHLRLFANYLTPVKGMLSQDTWRAIAVVTRNLLMNWLILVPMIVGLVLAGQLYFVLHPHPAKYFIFYPDVDADTVKEFAADRWEKDVVNSDHSPQNEWASFSLPLPAGWDEAEKDKLQKDFEKAIKTPKQIPPEERETILSKAKPYWLEGFHLPASQSALHRAALAKRLRYALEPLIALAGWIALLVVSWLLLTLHPKSHRERLVILSSLLASIAVLVCILLSFQFYEHVQKWLLNKDDWALKAIWLGVAALLSWYVWLPRTRDETASANEKEGERDDNKEWRVQMWRNRITSVHAKMLMLFVLMAAVLAVAGFGHEIIKLGSTKNMSVVAVVLIAAASLIFSAYKASPLGGGDKRDKSLPSLLTRFMFAITPILVIIVIALLAAWAGHKVVSFFWQRNLHSKSPLLHQPSLYVEYGAFFGVALCFVLAVVEMKCSNDRRRKPWIYLYAFLALLAGLLPFGVLVEKRSLLSVLALLVCIIGAAFIFFQLHDDEGKEARAAAGGRASDEGWLQRAGEVAVELIAVAIYCYCVFYQVRTSNLLHPGGALWNHFYAMTLLLAVTLAGAFILYRLLIVRSKGGVELAFFRNPESKHGAEVLWLAVLGCGVVVVLASCIVQGFITSNFDELGLIKVETKSAPDWIERLNVIEELFSHWFGLYAPFYALPSAAASLAGGIIIGRRILHSAGKAGSYRSWKAMRLVVLLLFSILVAVSAGPMSFEVLHGVIPKKDYSQLSTLTSFTLAGIVFCLALTCFELKWGIGNNRPFVWLIAFTYFSLVVLLVHSMLPVVHEHERYEYGFAVFGLLVNVITGIIGLGWLANPNYFSMHRFYKSRLVRAYLGASNRNRNTYKKGITEAAAFDDVWLSKLQNCEKGAPYHLINTTLNLADKRDLEIAQRSANPFLLSQLYCGSLRTGYRPTSEYMCDRLSLGTAVAISGAAASPNMGSLTPTSATAMLMALLNIRLGYWVPTPRKEDWKSPQPHLWPFYLLREFLSRTNDLSSYCYLTDGGHFDNTGLYSLVERGCSFIVVADCGADQQSSFSDLGDAIRRCRIDFGAEIDFNIRDFIEAKSEPLKKTVENHFIVGKVTYSKWHLKELGVADAEKREEGIIVLIKPSLTPSDEADVRQYAIENDVFPHTTTANQWFDESQFESYRRLGELSAYSLHEKYGSVTTRSLARGKATHKRPSASDQQPNTSKITVDQIKKLFYAIRDDHQKSGGIPNQAPRMTSASDPRRGVSQGE